MVPPWDLVPYANCGGTDFVHDIVHIAQTGPQGHFSVGPQRGRGLSPPAPVHATAPQYSDGDTILSKSTVFRMRR